MIVVTGAPGQLGHAIVERLLDRAPAERIGVSVRDPAQVADLAARGVRVRQGDYGDAASLRTAFEGASQVLLISSNAGAFLGGDPIAQHRTAITAAREAGASRILYTSHQASSPTSAFGPARDHAATEALLADCGVPFVSLRNGFYTSSLQYMLGDAPKTGELAAPRNGEVSWTSPADLAEAAAIILSSTDTQKLSGPVTLTAGQMVDFVDVAKLLTEVVGKEIRYTEIPDEAHTASLVAHGVPEHRAKLFLSTFVAMRDGEFAVVDPMLERLLGRPPKTVREALAPLRANASDTTTA